jgi:hypothetical protein
MTPAAFGTEPEAAPALTFNDQLLQHDFLAA